MLHFIPLSLLIIFLFFITPRDAVAQQSEMIKEPGKGVSYRVPEGWVFEKNGDGYIFAHASITGLMVTFGNNYKTLHELSEALLGGFKDEGVTLSLTENISSFGDHSIKGFYEGTMNGQNTRAYVIGLVNPLGGQGLNCMVFAPTGAFSDLHVASLNELARSVRFSRPQIPAIVKEWDDFFKNPGGCRLHHLSSYSSSGYGGGYANTRSEAIIDLCSGGSFSYSASSGFSAGVNSGSAYSNSDDDGTGTWSVGFNGTNPVLVLNFNNGEVAEYEITYIDNKTYLNGVRYFLLSGDDGPGCD